MLVLVSRCESARIASVLPTCVIPFPTNVVICASQERVSLDIYEGRGGGDVIRLTPLWLTPGGEGSRGGGEGLGRGGVRT